MKQIIAALQLTLTQMDDLMMDYQDKAEAELDEAGIVVPEDAAPDLDAARSHVYDAIQLLKGEAPLETATS